MGWRELDIDAGLGGGEETQRFGPRNEKGSSLYQVDTVACISPKGDEEASDCPPISSIANQAGVCLVVANHVLVFDESCSSYKVNFTFASEVDCIAWIPEPNFLAIAQSSGVLSLVHVPSQKVILSQPLLNKEANKDHQFRNLVFCPVDDGNFELEILPSKGSMIKLLNMDLKSLDEGISSGDTSSMKTILDRISHEIIDVSFIHSESLNHIATYESQVQRFLISGKGELGLSIWEKELDGKMSMVNSASDYIDEDIGFLKCLVTPNEDFFIALDTEHHVSIWSTAFLTPLIFHDDVEVQDFMLFSTNAVEEDNKKKDPLEEIKLVILTMPEGKKSLLQVYSLPNFEHVYTLQVSGCSKLASFDSHLDSIYFIEGVEDDLKDDSMFEDDNNNEEMDVSTIRLRCLTEALPYSRFMRLLHKNKFDQAEEFAKQFDLDVEVVYGLKASAIINRFEPRSKLAPKTEEEYAAAIQELKDCLDKLTDASEVIYFCLNAALPTFHATFDLLKYAKKRLESKEIELTSASNFESLLDGLNRLVTFEVAFGAQKFSASNWASFLNASLLDEVMNCFESDVAAAIVIWRRHQPELELGFTLSKLERFLASIPDNVPSTKIIQWLREDFVPFVLTKVPEGQMPLAKWLDARARHMELSEKDNWPHNALELAEVMFKAFSDVAKSNYGRGNATPAQFAMQVCRLSIPCSAPDSETKEEDEDSLAAAMAKLGDLVTCLREISILHSDFACKLSLHCYQQENIKTIAFRLLDRVLAPELIPGTVERYLRPYAAKHNLVADDLLLAYVKDLIVGKPDLVSSIWHSKLISVVECITDQELKCTAAMQIMDKAATPWSSDVKQLADAMMKAYPKNESLRRFHKFAELKTTMLQYGIRNYSSVDPVRGHGTIHYIFQCDTESALKDAKQVAETFETDEHSVYFFRIKSWIMNDKVEECRTFLRSMDVGLSVKTTEKIVKWAISSLEDPPLDDEDKEQCTKRLKAAIEVIRTVSSLDADFKRENQVHLKTLQNITALQVEYDIYLSYEEYNEQQKKDEIWRTFMTKCENNKDKKKDKRTVGNLKAIRLADLLGFDHVSRQRQELAVLRTENNFVGMLRILRDVRNGIPSHNQLRLLKDSLINLATEKWHSVKGEDLLQWLSNIASVHRLAAFGTSLCNEDEIRDFLEITQCLRLALLVSEQCESADYRQDAFRQTDTFANWNFTDRYEDDGMVLYSYEVIPLLRLYYKSFLREDQSHTKYETQTISGSFVTEKALKHVGEANKRLIKVLLENHLQTIALQFILQVYGACLQNFACCDAGFAIPEHLEMQVRPNEDILVEMLQFGKSAAVDVINTLYVKVLTHRQVDHDLALSYLTALPPKESLEVMTSLKEKFANKFRRMEVAAIVGVDYAGLIGDANLVNNCQNLQNAAYWGKKFIALKIPFDDVYKLASFDIQQKSDVIKLLVTNKNITLNTLLKFCQTFAYDEDAALLAYTKTQLLPQGGTTEDPACKDKVLQAISLVNSAENLFEMLHSVFNVISPYDYDRLSLVLSQMAKIKPGSTELLQALLDQLYSYVRCSQPSEYELSFSSLTEDEQLLRGCDNILPEISKVRLPFHALIGGSPWKILSPELKSETNARQLENVTRCLNLDTNKLYATTVHNIVNNQLQMDEKTALTNAKAKKATFRFEDVKGLLANIKDPELAIAATQWVAKLLPVGEEKVKVLKACVQFCSMSEKTSSEAELQKMKEWASRLGALCKRIEVEAILIKYGIKDEGYKNMTNQPVALIEKLYEDYGCKGEIVNGRVVGIPNIHEAADEIAMVHRINLANIHERLLENWLPNSKASGLLAGDTTLMDASMMISEDEDPQEDEKNLKRVIYILNKRTQAKNAEFLLHFAFKESSARVTNVCRIRAMQALFALASVKVIEASQCTDSGLEGIRLHLTSLMYLAELESLHLPQTLADFNRCNKAGLVRGLWRNHSHEPKGVRLIADLCLDYQIYDVQLWNILLPQLLSFGMMDYLRHTVVVLSAIPELREISCLAKMWRSVILAPFSSVSTPLSEDEEIACLEAANLLQRCPVILDLSMQDVAKRYQNIGMFTQALLCLTLIPENAVRERCLEKLFEDVGCFTILDKVEAERNRGKFEGHLDHVQEEVFSYLNKKKMYEEILKSSYLQKFIAYLASSNQLNDLILETIISGRFKNAVQLVHLYDKIAASSTSNRSKTSELKGVQRLMVFLQDNNLFQKAAQYFPDFQTEDPYSVEF